MSKKIHLSVATLAIAMFASIASPTLHAQIPNGPGPVTVYEGGDFRGEFLSLVEGRTTIGNLRSSIGNDRISSIFIQPGFQVRACANSRMRGRCATFNNSTPNLRPLSLNNSISSLTVSPAPISPPVTVFSNTGFAGNAYSLGEGRTTIQELKRSNVRNDTISSISIREGYRVRACSNSGMRGRCVTFTSDVRNLRRDVTPSFNDAISSLAVSRVNPPPRLVARNDSFTFNAEFGSRFNSVLPIFDNDQDPSGTLDFSPENIIIIPADRGNVVGSSTDTGGVFYETTSPADTSFRYVLVDDQGFQSNEATVTIRFDNPNGINIRPIANDDFVALEPGQATARFNLFDNDVDPDGRTLEIINLTQPFQGTVRNVGNGVVEYTATGTRNFDFFSYTVEDANGDTANAEVNINILGR